MAEKKPKTEIDHAFRIFDEESQRVLKDIKQILGGQELPPPPRRRQRQRRVAFSPFGG